MNVSPHFTYDELKCKCGCGRCIISPDLIIALEHLRELAGKPVHIHSAYRCDKHNTGISLVQKSTHPLGQAADWDIVGLTLQEMYELALRVPQFNRGGIGAYKGRYMHCDVRPNGPARWSYIGETAGGIDKLVTIAAEDLRFQSQKGGARNV